MLERIELTKRRDAADEVKRWRHATMEERSRAIAELADWAERIIEGRGYDGRDPLPPNPLRERVSRDA